MPEGQAGQLDLFSDLEPMTHIQRHTLRASRSQVGGGPVTVTGIQAVAKQSGTQPTTAQLGLDPDFCQIEVGSFWVSGEALHHIVESLRVRSADGRLTEAMASIPRAMGKPERRP